MLGGGGGGGGGGVAPHYGKPWCLLSKIQPYLDTFTSYSEIFSHIVAYLEPCITVAYSEVWHIRNPRYIQNSVKAYPGIFRTLCNTLIRRTLLYSELCHIQNVGCWHIQDQRHIQNLVYLGTFRHIQTYSIMKILRFLHTFQRMLECQNEST